MSNIITWCNENCGFVSAALSLFSLITSITTIAISVSIAWLPYKKKLDIWSYNDQDMPNFRTVVEIVNTGNKGIRIRDIEISCEGQFLAYKYFEPTDRQYIAPTDEISIPIVFHLEGNYANKIMEIIVTDTDNKKYRIKSSFAMG